MQSDLFVENQNTITRFGLIRHATTVWNQAKRIQGQSDTPLTPEGEKEAREWGRLLESYKWDRIISSDIGRALRTTAIINGFLQVPVATDCRLREQDWGNWTGKTFAQIQKETPHLLAEQVAAEWGFCPPGGEDRNSVWERSRQAIQDTFQNWPGKNILVVAHEGVIKCWIYRLYEYQLYLGEFTPLRPYHLHWLVHDQKELRIEKTNAIALN